nr:hypothetical protein CFP56_13426 [Quercus suber]
MVKRKAMCCDVMSGLAELVLHKTSEGSRKSFVNSHRTTTDMDEEIIDPSSLHLVENVAKLLTTGKHSDFEIKCDDCVWAVHKVVISSHSPVFAKMCDAHFMVPSQEGGSNKVTLAEDDPRVVNAMIAFMYTAKYVASNEDTLSGLVFDVRMAILADKYDVFDLDNQARYHFEVMVKVGGWNSADFAHAIGELYAAPETHCTGLLKAIAVSAATKHNKVLLLSAEGAFFREMMDDTPVFGRELAVSLAWLANSSKGSNRPDRR